jgi:hypothetical protein
MLCMLMHMFHGDHGGHAAQEDHGRALRELVARSEPTESTVETHAAFAAAGEGPHHGHH